MAASGGSWGPVISSEDRGGEDPAAVVRVQGWETPQGALLPPHRKPGEAGKKRGSRGQQRDRRGGRGFTEADTLGTRWPRHIRKCLSFFQSVFQGEITYLPHQGSP